MEGESTPSNAWMQICQISKIIYQIIKTQYFILRIDY